MSVARNSHPASRRSARPVRSLVAVVLLITALAAGVTAIVVGTTTVLTLAVIHAVAAGAVAARLLSDETAQVRRDWARDRAAIAHTQSRESTRRAREQVSFAEVMARKVVAAESEVRRLATAVQAAEAATAEALERHRVELVRAEDLESRLAVDHAELLQARAELLNLQDALAASQSAELEARTELLAWQQSDESRRYA